MVLYSAEKREELHFKLLDRRNQAAVRYERKNEKTGEEVPWSEIVKGYAYDDGTYVLLGDEDFKRAAVEATQTVDIQDFVDEEAIAYVFFDKPYYLVPGNKGEKGYVLLRETLRRQKKAGIAKVVLHTRQYLAALLVEGDALLLNLLRFRDELRNPKEFEFPSRKLEASGVSAKELTLAERLVESMASDWDPERYRDDYRDALLKWIEHKVQTGQTSPAPATRSRVATERSTGNINIMDLLKKSVEQTAKTRSAKPPTKARPAAKSKSAHAARPSKRKRAG